MCKQVNILKLLYHANDVIEAHIIAGMLQAQDIPAWVGGYYLQGGVGELAPMGFATVMVPDADLPIASSILEEYLKNSDGKQTTEVITGSRLQPAS